MTSVPSRVIAWTLPESELGLAHDRLDLLQLGCVVERQHLGTRGVVRPTVVDRLRDPGLLQRHRRIGHDGGAFWDAGEDRAARGVQVVDDLDAEPVLFQPDDRLHKRLVVGQRGEAV
jgi:hypothetical protein